MVDGSGGGGAAGSSGWSIVLGGGGGIGATIFKQYGTTELSIWWWRWIGGDLQVEG